MDVCVHVADVVVGDQLFISNFNQRDGSCLPPRGVTFYHRHFYKFKTGVRLPLTSQINELEQILQKLSMHLDKSWSTK